MEWTAQHTTAPIMGKDTTSSTPFWQSMQSAVEQLRGRLRDAESFYAVVADSEQFRGSNCPLGMTLAFRVWELTRKDREASEKKLQQTKAKYKPEDWAYLEAENAPICQQDRDESSAYRDAMENYAKKGGRVTQKEMINFKQQRALNVARMLRDTDVLFATPSTAGSPIVRENFEPTIVVYDEAGGLSVPDMVIPLISFDKWEAMVMLGDPQQLETIVPSREANEFVQNASMSALGL